MLDALIGLFRPKTEPAKKHEWSIADDLHIRARYAREIGAHEIYVTTDEYMDALSADELYVVPYHAFHQLSDPKAPHLYWDGMPVVIRNKDE